MQGYRTKNAAKVNYRLGANKERIMFYRRRESLKQSYQAKVLDCYPRANRGDVAFQPSIT
jgi:hypothetical protein